MPVGILFYGIAQRSGDRSDLTVLAGDDRLEGGGHVAEQVLPADHLRGIGRSDAVACNDLDAGMRPQPGRRRLGSAVRHSIENGVLFQVNEDRAEAPSVAPSHLVDAPDPRRDGRHSDARVRPHEAQQRVGARRKAAAPRQTFAGLAAVGKPEMALGVAPTGEGLSDGGDGLAEGLPGAGRIAAREAAQRKVQDERAFCRGRSDKGAGRSRTSRGRGSRSGPGR